MKHEYSTQQIEEASDLASNGYTRIGINFLLDFLDALPEPASDDWVECGFNDFRPTDKRVKAVFIGGSIIEGTPDRRNHEHVFLVDGPVIHSYDDATFYRIPAPVTPPDPAEHKYILDVDGYLWIWSKSQGKYVEPETLVQSAPAEFDEWSPAKVVADDA